jgi:hypothetical protein
LHNTGKTTLGDTTQANDDDAIRSASLILAKLFLVQLKNKKQELYDFVLFLGVDPQGTIQSAEAIRSRIPHVIFFARICLMYLKLENQDILPSNWISYFESSNMEETISSLQMLMGYLKSVGDVSALSSSIFWKRNIKGILDYTELIIDRTTVTLDILRQGISNTLNEAENLIEKLYENYSIPQINLDYIDQITNLEYGSSLESEEMIDQYQSMVHDTAWINKFVRNGVWDQTICNSWIETCDRLGYLLLFITHVTYGQPARGTELEAMLLCNSNQIQRSIFVLDERVCIVEGYHKAFGLTGQERYIPRFLNKKISKLLVLFLVFARKWQQYVLS